MKFSNMKFTVLIIKFCITRGESNVHSNVLNSQNISTFIEVLTNVLPILVEFLFHHQYYNLSSIWKKILDFLSFLRWYGYVLRPFAIFRLTLYMMFSEISTAKVFNNISRSYQWFWLSNERLSREGVPLDRTFVGFLNAFGSLQLTAWKDEISAETTSSFCYCS